MTTILPLPTVTHHFSSHPPRNWPATGRSCLACEELSWPCCTSMATSKRLIWLTISNDQNMSKPLNTCCDPGEHKHSSWIGGSIWVFSPRIWHLNAFEVLYNIYIHIIYIYISAYNPFQFTSIYHNPLRFRCDFFRPRRKPHGSAGSHHPPLAQDT
jgi:hypothetical protein